MSARVGGLRSGSRIHPNRVGRGADAGSAAFVGPPRHCGSVVRIVGGPDITPSSADKTPHGLAEGRCAGHGRSGLTWFARQPAAIKRFGALTFQNASIRGGYAHGGW